MKTTIQLKKSRYFIFLVLLLLGLARLPGYGQDLHTPYPIIFVHGINGSDETWNTDGYDIVDFLQEGTTPLKYGGVLNITLDKNRSNTSLSNTIDSDVHAFIPDTIKADFYIVNFNVHSLGGIPGGVPGDPYECVGHVLLSAPIFENDQTIAVIDPEKFQRGDIIKIQGEFMQILNVVGGIIEVDRGKLGSDASFHFLPNEIFNLSNESNQASIAKQGVGLKMAIDAVIKKTKAKKVILVGHSMGGLAIREYIQSSYYRNDVAKIVTIGTPHLGSNITDLPTALVGVDPKSDAVRDLRTTINSTSGEVDGIYLFGGQETISLGYYSKDVNGNGTENDLIRGLNQFQYHKFPENISRTFIVSSSILGGGDDLVVPTISQYMLDPKDTIRTRGSHLAEPTNIYALIRGLDEPDEKELAYEIGENSTNKGFITFGKNYIEQINLFDEDWYKLNLNETGLLKLNFEASSYTGISSLNLYNAYEDDPVATIYNKSQSIEYQAEPGTYYVKIRGLASWEPNASYQYPYTLNTQFTATPPAAMAVSPGSLQFYDVVMNAPKGKTVTLTNNGTSNILITGIGLTGADADQFTVAPMPPIVLTPELPLNLTVTFNPTSTGAKVASIEITTNSPDIPTKKISLKGNGTDHETMVLVSNPSDIYYYGNTKVSTSKNKTFTLQNTGSNTCTISDLALEGLNPNEYTITAPTVLPFDLATGATKQITVKFSPTSIGVKNAALAISNNSDVPKLSIDLYGNGTENYYSGSNNTIAAYEYWFDDQYGSKVNTPVIKDRESFLNAQLSTDGLQTGLHSFHIRYKDQKGKWSAIVSEFFHKLPVTAAGSRKITASEYWFDDAFDTKVSSAVTPDSIVSVNSGLDVASLSNGLHSYHVRYKDDAGQWSSVVSEFFHKLPVTASGSRKITASEYWFDDAFDTKVLSAITPGQTITVNSGLDVASLQNGLHSYHVRYKDDAGQWSSVVSEFFHKLPASISGTNLITTYRYWFDRNETAIQTVNLPTPVNPYQLVRDINTCSLTDGDHTIHFQFRDSNHAWSSVATDTITKSANSTPEITAIGAKTFCQGNSVTLTSSDADSYLWSNGEKTQSIVVIESGNYTVTVNKDSGCEKTSEVTAIVVNPLPKATGVISGNGNVARNQSNVLYSVPVLDNASSYIWTLPNGASGTSTTNSITVSYGNEAVSGDIKVKGHNDCGDGPESSLAISVGSIVTQNIALNIGWNIISANLIPVNVNLKDLFQPLIDAGKLKKVMDEAGKTLENLGAFGGWRNSIGNLNTAKGYKVNVTATSALSLEGAPVQLPYDMALNAGWNIISYPSASIQDAKALVQSLIDAGKLKKVMDEAGKTIENLGAFGGWRNSIGNFIPGKGYKVNVTANCVLTIPANGNKSAVVVPELLASEHFKPVFTGNGTDHMNIHLVNLQNTGIQVGDEIGIFDGKLCVGSATIGAEQLMDGSIGIPASCDDGLTSVSDGFVAGHPVKLKLFRNIKEYTLKIEPVLNSQNVFTKGESIFVQVGFDQTTGLDELANQTTVKCYPNPFSDQINIEIVLQEPQKLEVRIYDVNGKLVRSLYKSKTEKRTNLIWDGKNDSGSEMVPGSYYLKANSKVEKIMLR